MKTLINCPTLLLPILDVIPLSETMLLMAIRKVSFRIIYSGKWSNTRTLPAQKFDFFFKFQTPYAFLDLCECIFCPHQVIPYFEVPSSVSDEGYHSRGVTEILCRLAVHRSTLKRPQEGLPVHQAKFLPLV